MPKFDGPYSWEYVIEQLRAGKLCRRASWHEKDLMGLDGDWPKWVSHHLPSYELREPPVPSDILANDWFILVGFRFEDVLPLIRKGKRARRSSWPPSDYIELVDGNLMKSTKNQYNYWSPCFTSFVDPCDWEVIEVGVLDEVTPKGK